MAELFERQAQARRALSGGPSHQSGEPICRTVTPIERAAAAAVAGTGSFASFDGQRGDLDRRDEDGLARVMAQLQAMSEAWLV